MGYILLGILAFLFIFGIRIVPPKRVRVVLTLGKATRVLREGINVIVPIIEWTRSQTLAMTNLPVKVDGITHDNVKTAIELNVIFKVKEDNQSIMDSLFIINDPIIAIRSMVEEELRAKIYTFEHDEIFGKRNEIGDEVKKTLAVKLSEFGMALDSVQVKDIALDAKVMEAMNSVIASEKNKLAQIRHAEGEKQADILKAEADKEVKKLLGEGMALQREAIANGFSNSIEEIKSSDPSLMGGQILEFLLASSRIETLEKIGDKNSKIIYVNESLEGKMSSLVGSANDSMK